MKVTIRADSVNIEGYVNAVGRDSRRMVDEHGNSFVEQIQPGTFATALNRSTGAIPMLLDHDTARKLSDTDNGLMLEEDSIGLRAEVTVTDPEVMELAKAKKLTGWSFGFNQLDSRVSYDYDNHIERSIVTELELVEVSLIDDKMRPCYSGTSVHTRAEAQDVKLRAMDGDTISYMSEIAERAEDIAPTDSSEEKKQEPSADYSRYHKTIESLRR